MGWKRGVKVTAKMLTWRTGWMVKPVTNAGKWPSFETVELKVGLKDVQVEIS